MTHTIDRRRFLQLLGTTGLAVHAAGALRPQVAWAGEGFQGPYVLTIHAGGGWDPTLLCDPKGLKSDTQSDPVNKSYYTHEIEQVGPFSFAPLNGHRAFFERVRDQLVVINGIDCQTNSHETGTIHTWSGTMDAGAPAFSALHAALLDPRPSISFLSNGDYDATAGLVPPTRIPDVGAIQELAYPNRLVTSDPTRLLHTTETIDRIEQARRARLERQLAASTLPRWSRALEQLRAARSGDNELAALTAFLPESLDTTSALRSQAQVAMACFKAGVSASATMSTGGFDTHGNHDVSHTTAMTTLIDGVMFALDEAERQGIADKVIFLIGSDFSRTPWYNDTNGKDHWSISSMMMMGPGITGGRVIGATDDVQVPLTVDPTSLALDENGIRITPGHIHAALRELVGIAGDPRLAPWDVGTSLPFFT